VFKTVTAVTGAGWAIAEDNDTVVVGFGTKVGLPQVIAAAGNVDLTTLGTAIIEATATGGAAISVSTIDASSGTYDGLKKLRVWIHN
jgi:hypothetical protein